MKRFISLALASTLAFVSCTKQVEELAALHMQLMNLQSVVEQLNSNAESIDKIIASMNSDFIDEVTVIEDKDGNCIGYTLHYVSGNSIPLYFGVNGEDGKDGEDGEDGKDGRDGKDGWDGKDGRDGWDGRDGKDGHTPVLSTRKDTDGVWYWTVDNDWLLDSNGSRIRLGEDGISPKMKVENGSWWVSYDGGKSWKYVCNATAGYTSIFSDIDYTSSKEMIYLKLTNGVTIPIPRHIEISVKVADGYRYFIAPDSTISIPFEVIGGSGDITCENSTSGALTVATTCESSGKCHLSVTAGANFKRGKVALMIHRNSRTFMKVFEFNLRMEGLSSEGRANCYIISEPGTYKFYAMTKGNSEDSVDGTPAKALVLWESFGRDNEVHPGELIKSAHFSNGYITFETAKDVEDGNALIAIMDDNDAILWSWHIWCVTDYRDGIITNTFASHPENPLLDRYLGAVSGTPGAIGTRGLLYQWGRKDPFLGTNYTGYEWDEFNSVESTAIWPEPEQGTISIGNYSYAHSHPMTYLTYGNNIQTWNIELNEEGWKRNKTISDPCPPGWMVPVYDNIWEEIYRYKTYDDAKNGWWVKEPYSKPKAWFPRSFVRGNSGELRSYPYEPECWAGRESYGDSENWMPYFSHISKEGWHAGTNVSEGRSIRCCKE